MSRTTHHRRLLEPGVAPYAPLPYAVLRRTDVGLAAKCLVAAIADLTPNKDNRRLASLGFLARQIGASRATVIRARQELRRLNIIEYEQLPGRRAAYKLLLTPLDSQNGIAPGNCADLPKGSQDDTTKGSQSDTAAVSDCNGGGINLRPPLASLTLSTDLYHSPRGVPPLVWRELVVHLQTTYAEAWGPGTAPPGRWYDLMAQEVRGGQGNLDLVRNFDAKTMRAGKELAGRQKRPYGFRWVVLAAQERQTDLADAQRAKDATGANVAANRAATARAAAEDHQASLREMARTRLEYFKSLPEEHRRRYLDAARARHPGPPNPNYLAGCAAVAAWADYELGEPAEGGQVHAEGRT